MRKEWVYVVKEVKNLRELQSQGQYTKYTPVICQMAVCYVESWLLKKWDPQPDLDPGLHEALPSSQLHLLAPHSLAL
jgi:hypothetical protein